MIDRAHLVLSLVLCLLGSDLTAQESEPASKPVEKPAAARPVRNLTASRHEALEADEALKELAQQLDRTNDSGTEEELQKLVETARKLAAEKSTALRQHYLGLSQYLLASRLDAAEPKRSKELLREAARAFEKALADDPKLAESHSTLAMCVGMQIDMNEPQQMMMLAMQAQEHLAKAKALDADNPIVRVHTGTFTYFTPEEFGGGPEAARTDFEAALKVSPDYGDAMVWLACCRQALGDTEGAEDLKNRIEKRHPENRRLQQLLDVFLNEDF